MSRRNLKRKVVEEVEEAQTSGRNMGEEVVEEVEKAEEAQVNLHWSQPQMG